MLCRILRQINRISLHLWNCKGRGWQTDASILQKARWAVFYRNRRAMCRVRPHLVDCEHGELGYAITSGRNAHPYKASGGVTRECIHKKANLHPLWYRFPMGLLDRVTQRRRSAMSTANVYGFDISKASLVMGDNLGL